METNLFGGLTNGEFGDLSYTATNGETVTNERLISFFREYAKGNNAEIDIGKFISDSIAEREKIIRALNTIRDNRLTNGTFAHLETTTREGVEAATRFKDCRTIAEMQEILLRSPAMASGEREYTADDLTSGVEVARNTNYKLLDGITSSENLRTLMAKIFISDVENFVQLKNLVQQIDAIEGSNQVYKKDELLDIINTAETAGGYPIETVTHSYGFRDALIRCLPAARQNQ